MPVVSLAGAAYVAGHALESSSTSCRPCGKACRIGDGNVALMVRGLLMLAALTGLLVSRRPSAWDRGAPGVRAGIFVGLVGFLLVLLLTRWASLWIEYWSFDLGIV